MNKIVTTLILAAASISPAIAAPGTCSVSISQEPVVLRVGKDEFRIAFGVTGEQCRESGCSGVIRYQASWRTEDGAVAIDRKALSYHIPDGGSRSIAVDRHYFDTAEAKQTTSVVRVDVDEVSCARPANRLAVK
jgi:hypothetical protein